MIYVIVIIYPLELETYEKQFRGFYRKIDYLNQRIPIYDKYRHANFFHLKVSD